MNVTNLGFVGSLPKSYLPMSESPSAQWPSASGVEYLYAAGIWVGALMDGIPVVSTGYPETEFYPSPDPRDVIYETSEGDPRGRRYPGRADDDLDGLVDEDLPNGMDDDGDGLIDEDFAAVGKQMFSCRYTDDQENAVILWPEHTPMGVHIRQESYQWGEDEYNDFIAVHYEITNRGNDFLEDVYIGIFADLDAGPRTSWSYHLDDQVGFRHGLHCGPKDDAEIPVRVTVGYVYDNDGDSGGTPGYFGVALLGHTTEMFSPSSTFLFRAFRTFRGLMSFEKGGEPTNDFERYDALSNERIDVNTTDPGDYKVLLSIGPFDEIPPDSTIMFDVAFVCGAGLEEMLWAAATAAVVYKGIWFNKDGNWRTGRIGRETPIPGPIAGVDPDTCDEYIELPIIFRGDTLWCNLDCAEEIWYYEYYGCYRKHDADFEYFQTGVRGRETQLKWAVGSAPPPPKMRIVPGDNRIGLFWDNLSEVIPDAATLEYDFEGYRIWRADDWHRPLGTNIQTGPSNDLWRLLADLDLVNGVPPDLGFKRPYERGGWMYEPLGNLPERDELIELFMRNLADTMVDTIPCPPYLDELECDTLEALARWELGLDGGRQYYVYIDDRVKNGLPYFYAVTSYDHKIRDEERVPGGKYNTPSTNFMYAEARSEAQPVEGFDGGDIYVVPNPVMKESLAPWRKHPNNSDPSGLKVEFRNLPRCRNTIRIFTVSGDLVQILHHDGRDGTGSMPWNLISRNGQDVTSGVYLFSVEPDDGRFPRTVGKFVVIR
jgi:hypothetical protein